MDLLTRIARQVLTEKDFLIDFTPRELAELDHIHPDNPKNVRDLRDKDWISIDNDDSLDLDQLTYAEGNIFYVAVADVARLVPKDSLIDLHAAHNTTSLYTPTQIFPMLPTKLSNDLTSLNPGVDRYAVVVEMEVNQEGMFHLREVYPALVHNQAKLTYNKVTEWLENGSAADQIQLQDEIAQKIKAYRIREGALQFETIDLVPKMQGNVAVGLVNEVQNRAQELIENFMIGANVCMSNYFISKKWPLFKRVVRTPKRWDRLCALALNYGYTLPEEPDGKALQNFLAGQKRSNPDHFPDLSLAVIKLVGRGEYIFVKPGEKSPGHFDLALDAYAHTTAPNRRYPDLIMQRIFKGIPYTDTELTSFAAHCTQKEEDAAKADRRILKSSYAMVLSNQIGQSFGAMVTGVNEHGTWVRIDNPPVEGKLIEGYLGIDVGDRLTVKLVSTDVKRGFIDFKRVT